MNLTRKQLRSKGIDIIITPVFIKEAKEDSDHKEYSFYVYNEKREPITVSNTNNTKNFITNPCYPTYESAEEVAIELANKYLNTPKTVNKNQKT